jgi:sugar phosphate isomerase/epimerase
MNKGISRLQPRRGFNIGASSFAGTLLELKKEVESIELYIPKMEVYEGTKLVRSRIKNLIDALSVYELITSIHAPYFSDVPSYPPELNVDTAHLDDVQERLLRESILIAETLGSRVVVIHPGRINGNRRKSFDSMVSGLAGIAQFAEDRNVTLGLENKEGTAPGNLCCSASELIETIEQVGRENMKSTFDIGHANLTCGGDQVKLRDFTRALKGYVIHVHIHDNSGTLTEKYWGDIHGAPGTGIIDFSILKELDFRGIYNLEVFSVEDVRAGKMMLMEVGKNIEKKTPAL